MSKVVTPILFFIIAVGLFFTYIRPAYDVLVAFQAQEEELDVALQETEQLIQKYDTLMTNYSSISSEDKARLNKILPQEIDVVRLILDLDSLATKNNMEIISFEVPQLDSKHAPVSRSRTAQRGTSDEDSPIGNAVLTIECEGEYLDFKNFIYDIERSLLLMDMVALEIEVPDMSEAGTEPDAKPSFTLGLQSYWLK